jgi:hypothetical protein
MAGEQSVFESPGTWFSIFCFFGFVFPEKSSLSKKPRELESTTGSVSCFLLFEPPREYTMPLFCLHEHTRVKIKFT